jgi:hypothetical protein
MTAALKNEDAAAPLNVKTNKEKDRMKIKTNVKAGLNVGPGPPEAPRR